MFPDYHLIYSPEGALRPDRRPLPTANEIRLRIKRSVIRKEV